MAGIIGGLIGNPAFGALMAMMGMLPMIALLVGSEAAIVGGLVHMLIAAVIGAGFGLLLSERAHSFGQGALAGLLYEVVWWVLGPLILMPLMMGKGAEGSSMQIGAALTMPLLMGLMGRLVYGALTGLGYIWYTRR